MQIPRVKTNISCRFKADITGRFKQVISLLKRILSKAEIAYRKGGEIEGGDRYSTQQVPGEGGQRKRELSLLASQTFFRLTQSFVDQRRRSSSSNSL